MKVDELGLQEVEQTYMKTGNVNVAKEEIFWHVLYMDFKYDRFHR